MEAYQREGKLFFAQEVREEVLDTIRNEPGGEYKGRFSKHTIFSF